MRPEKLLYLFPFLGDKFIQILIIIATLTSSIFAVIFWFNWEHIRDNPLFWDQYPNRGMALDGLVLLFIFTMATFSWRYFTCYFDEFEAKKSQLMGFWAVSIIIGSSYLYAMLEYRFDLPAQPGWVWAAAINGVLFVCWLISNYKFRT